MSNRTVAELLDAYMDQERMHCNEGRRGVENLCKIAGALGYNDRGQSGGLSNGSSMAGLFSFFEDNSGAIEAVLNWIRSRNFSEFREPLEALVPEDDGYENEEPKPDDYETFAQWEEAHNTWKEDVARRGGGDTEWNDMEPLFPNGVPGKI